MGTNPRESEYLIPGLDCSLALPVDALGVGPEVFESVITTRLLIEDVHHDIAVILHDPAARLISLDAEPFLILRAHVRVDLFREGVDLTSAGAGHQHEKVEDRRNAA